MDAFQGVEKRVILLSTVRSTRREFGPRTPEPGPQSVGFLADPKVSNTLPPCLPPLSIHCLDIVSVFMMLSSRFSPEVQRGHDARPSPVDRGGELTSTVTRRRLAQVRGRETSLSMEPKA